MNGRAEVCSGHEHSGEAAGIRPAGALVKGWLIIAVAIAGFAAAPSVWAQRHHHHRGHVGIGLYFGAPVFYGPRWYSPPPYYYYPQTVIVPAAPPMYIEQGAAAQPVYPAQPANPATPSQAYWYYCTDAQAYYPYVKHCPGGWQRVSPQPG